MTKPIFLNSKGDRGKDTGFETDDLEERYISAFASNYRYGNLPEGCPDDYIERAFYFTGCVSGWLVVANTSRQLFFIRTRADQPQRLL